jgi:hypothetical protein
MTAKIDNSSDSDGQEPGVHTRPGDLAVLRTR